MLKIFWIGLPLAMLTCIEILATSAVLAWHSDILFMDISLPGIYRLQFSVINIAIRAVFFIFFFRAEFCLEKLGYRVFILIGIPTLSFFSLFSLLAMLYDGRLDDSAGLVQVALMILLINVIFLYIVHLLSQANKAMLAQKLDEQKEYLRSCLRFRLYDQKLTTNDKMQFLQNALQEMIGIFKDPAAAGSEDGQDGKVLAEKYRTISAKLVALEDRMINFHVDYCTGDRVVDDVLCRKMDFAGSKRIKLDVETDIMLDNAYQSSVVGCILTVLLDHAIMVVDEIEDADCEKVIDVAVEMDGESCDIRVKNPVKNKKDQNTVLEMVENMIKVHGGTMDVLCDAYYLSATVFLPLNKLTVAI